jgi:hypothetical protein
MYIIRELQAQKSLYFAKVGKNGQKLSILTTIVVNLIMGAFEFGEAATQWGTGNATICDCLQISKKSSRPRADLMTVLGGVQLFTLR